MIIIIIVRSQKEGVLSSYKAIYKNFMLYACRIAIYSFNTGVTVILSGCI